MNSQEFLHNIQIKVKAFDKNAEIILFGSRARGDFQKDSDWDLLILLNTMINETIKEEIRNELFEFELETEEVISSIIQSKKGWDDLSITPLHKIIEEEGIKV